jgi:O-acetyl-ADP-ribose deacetylase (regulator of RNase III)
MSVIFKEKDVLSLIQDGDVDIFMHGCNCFHAQGSGIAKTLADAYPEVAKADKNTLRADRNKLGKTSYAMIQNNNDTPVAIINAYTQFYYGRKLQDESADIANLKSALLYLKHRFGGRGLRFGMPLIGADRGRLKPKDIHNVIFDVLGEEDVTIVFKVETGRRRPTYIQKFISSH